MHRQLALGALWKPQMDVFRGADLDNLVSVHYMPCSDVDPLANVSGGSNALAAVCLLDCHVRNGCCESAEEFTSVSGIHGSTSSSPQSAAGQEPGSAASCIAPVRSIPSS